MTTAHNDHLPAIHSLRDGHRRSGGHFTPALRDPHPAPLAADYDGYVGKPYCEGCGTDEFIYLESYAPPVIRRDGTIKTLGEVSYTCTRCEEFSGHKVPFTWAPAGWFLG